MLDTLRHLLPDSTAWRLVVERTLKKYLRGVATVGSDTVAYVDDVFDDLWPDLTRELDEWLDQFGIDYWPWANDDDMRAYLDFRWGEDRSTSPQALQDKLQAAGFDAYVYDSFDRTDVSLSTYTGDTFSLTNTPDPRGFCFADGGYKMCCIAAGTTNATTRYSLTAPYQLATASYDTDYDVVENEDNDPADIKLNPEGTKVFVLGNETNAILEYTLNTPFLLSSAQYVDSMSVSTQETAPEGFHWKPDGTEVYVTGTSSSDVHQYTLGTAWDVSTGGFTRTYDPGAGLTNSAAITFNERGTVMLLMPLPGDTVFQWDLGTAWDISTASAAGHNLDMSAEDSAPYHVVLEGNHLFMLGDTADDIFRYRYGAWRNPLTYADQPTAGTVQCGDDGSAQNPVAECGEEPTDQVSLDSAVCNSFLANEVWYLVNDTLTDVAPPPIPADSAQWGSFWYVGGTPIGTELEVDEYDRQRFEKLCLKHGPAEDWIVTIIDIWRTTLIGEWKYELYDQSLDTGEFQFDVLGTTVKIHDTDDDGTDQSTPLSGIAAGDKIRFVRDDDGSWIDYLALGAAVDQTTYWSVSVSIPFPLKHADWAGFPSAGGIMQIYHMESV